jgi:hypothetical protein
MVWDAPRDGQPAHVSGDRARGNRPKCDIRGWGEIGELFAAAARWLAYQPGVVVRVTGAEDRRPASRCGRLVSAAGGTLASGLADPEAIEDGHFGRALG